MGFLVDSQVCLTSLIILNTPWFRCHSDTLVFNKALITIISIVYFVLLYISPNFLKLPFTLTIFQNFPSILTIQKYSNPPTTIMGCLCSRPRPQQHYEPPPYSDRYHDHDQGYNILSLSQPYHEDFPSYRDNYELHEDQLPIRVGNKVVLPSHSQKIANNCRKRRG